MRRARPASGVIQPIGFPALGRAGKSGIAIAAIALGLSLPGSAVAAETIGQTGLDGGPCTNRIFVQHDLSGGTAYSASSSGVISSWSAAASARAGQTLQLVVVTQNADRNYTVTGRDRVRTLANLNALNTFTDVHLPIVAGQLIGVYVPDESQADCEADAATGDKVAFSEIANPTDGVPIDFESGSDSPFKVNAQAVVEPDADHDNFGDESQDKCLGIAGTASGCPSTITIDAVKQKGETKVKVSVTVPGAGTVQVGAAGKAVKPASLSVSATTTQTVSLKVKLTRSAAARLADNGKLKLKLKALYTPPGGSPATAIQKKKLKG